MFKLSTSRYFFFFFAASALAAAPAGAVMNGVGQDILPVTAVFQSSATMSDPRGLGVPRVSLSANVAVSSETSSDLGAGVRISTNAYIVGFSSAAKYYGDGSALTGLGAGGGGDSLGSHIATMTLTMNTFNIVSVGSITANAAITTYSSMTVAGNGGDYGLAVSSGVSLSGLIYTGNGRVGIGTQSPGAKLEVAGPLNLKSDGSNTGELKVGYTGSAPAGYYAVFAP